MEYKLITPITKADGTKIENVNVKESYTGQDLKIIGNSGSKGDGDALIALVSCSSGLSTSTVLNMDARDVRAIGEIARPFLAGGES